MEIKTKYFNILTEEEKVYFAKLKGAIESADELSSLEITRAPKHYSFRIAPSAPKYTNVIITELTKFHNTIGVRLDFSKSMKTSGAIYFTIPLPD